MRVRASSAQVAGPQARPPGAAPSARTATDRVRPSARAGPSTPAIGPAAWSVPDSRVGAAGAAPIIAPIVERPGAA